MNQQARVSDRTRREMVPSVNEKWKKMLENSVKKTEDTNLWPLYDMVPVSLANYLTEPRVRTKTSCKGSFNPSFLPSSLQSCPATFQYRTLRNLSIPNSPQNFHDLAI
jgi:hypothetical protein